MTLNKDMTIFDFCKKAGIHRTQFYRWEAIGLLYKPKKSLYTKEECKELLSRIKQIKRIKKKTNIMYKNIRLEG